MDYYDIYKKLTKGLQFKDRYFGVNKHLQNNKAATKDLDIKQDIKEIKTEEDDIGFEVGSGSDNENTTDTTNSDVEDKNIIVDNDMQIIEGIPGQRKDKKKKSKLKPEELRKKLALEEENQFRNEHGIKTVGRHVPGALRDCENLLKRYEVSKGLVETVTKCGYSELTPIQRQAIPCILENRQIVACAPTGSGKTAAFLLPLFHILGAPQGGPRALVLCPTRELAHQIYREALRLSSFTQLRCTVVKSLKESKIKERESTIRKSDIVISTPNRLCYLLNQDNVGISLDKVQWLIIDEADKMFEGSAEEVSAFRQQLDVVMAACASRVAESTRPAGQARIAMFSATHTPTIAKWARHNMRGLINVTVGHRNAASTNVEQQLMFCGFEDGKRLAMRQLIQKGIKPPVLVFVQSKERAKQLFKELIYDGIMVDVIHADRTQTQRDNVVRAFRLGHIWVLICTELMARGIDFRGVNLVINYDFPPSAISYIHRIGRAGRAGQQGKAITFFTQDDFANLRSIASVIKQSGGEVPDYMLKMKQNPNKRKKLQKKAPRRDNISTVLQKPLKRKLEDKEEVKTAKVTTAVKDSKPKKQRRKQQPPKNNNKETKRIVRN